MKTRKIEPERSVETDKHFWLNNSNTYSNQMKFRIEVVWCELASIRVLQCGSHFFQISCTHSKKKSNLSFFHSENAERLFPPTRRLPLSGRREEGSARKSSLSPTASSHFSSHCTDRPLNQSSEVGRGGRAAGKGTNLQLFD